MQWPARIEHRNSSSSDYILKTEIQILRWNFTVLKYDKPINVSVGCMGSVRCPSGTFITKAGIPSMALLPPGHPMKPPWDGLIILFKSYFYGSVTNSWSHTSVTGLGQQGYNCKHSVLLTCCFNNNWIGHRFLPSTQHHPPQVWTHIITNEGVSLPPFFLQPCCWHKLGLNLIKPAENRSQLESANAGQC